LFHPTDLLFPYVLPGIVVLYPSPELALKLAVVPIISNGFFLLEEINKSTPSLLVAPLTFGAG